MKTNQQLIKIVDSIFEEIEGIGCITLGYRLNPKKSTNCLKITSVNGYPDGLCFNAWLRDACKRVAYQFMIERCELSEAEKEQLLKYTLIRCRMLGAPSGKFHLKNFMPKKLLLRDESKNAGMGNNDMAAGFAGRYFVIRYHHLQKLAFWITMIASLDQYHPLGEANINVSAETPRLATNYTVQMLAVFAKVLFESGFFKDVSKMMVCRCFSSLFSTPRQKEISFQSFRNHFNQPDPSSLAEIVENLGKWMKNAEILQSCENDT